MAPEARAGGGMAGDININYSSTFNEVGVYTIYAGTYTDIYAVVLTQEMLPTLSDETGDYFFMGWKAYKLGLGYSDILKVGDTLDMSKTGYSYNQQVNFEAVWVTGGIPAQIARISHAVDDIKDAITEIGGAVPDGTKVDGLADIIRTLGVNPEPFSEIITGTLTFDSQTSSVSIDGLQDCKLFALYATTIYYSVMQTTSYQINRATADGSAVYLNCQSYYVPRVEGAVSTTSIETTITDELSPDYPLYGTYYYILAT